MHAPSRALTDTAIAWRSPTGELREAAQTVEALYSAAMATFYDPGELPAAIRMALTPHSDYITSQTIRALVDADPSPSAETLVCLASLLWSDAMVTNFDEDVVDVVSEVRALLKRATAVAPHAGAKRLAAQVSQRLKVAG